MSNAIKSLKLILTFVDRYSDFPDFSDNIEIGFLVCNGTIEVMSPERTKIVYSEYDEKYSEKNYKIYCPEY